VALAPVARWRSAVHIVKPETVLAWHRRGVRLCWTWKSRPRTRRPPVPSDVRALVRELSTANPLWGAPRIYGELQKLGISVSQSTVAKYMRRHPRPPSQTWRTFLRNHASQIMAADLFIVPTITFRVLYVRVIVAHERRRIVRVAVTEHPTAPWTAQQLRNAFPEDEAPGYLLPDRDGACAAVATTVAAMNIQAVRTAPRSPWQKDCASHCTSFVRFARTSCRGAMDQFPPLHSGWWMIAGVFIEIFRLVAVRVRDQEAVACPGLDRDRLDVEQVCGLVDREETAR
jgi:hypothetical protein